jgi:hypothetical protein
MAGGSGAGGQGDYSDHLPQSCGATLAQHCFAHCFLLPVLSMFCSLFLPTFCPLFSLTFYLGVFGAQEWREEHGGALRCHLGEHWGERHSLLGISYLGPLCKSVAA